MAVLLLKLVAGIALLFFGGDWLVDGASALARRLHISPLVIGLTVVGFGTSAPELLVSLAAAFKHNPDIAVANVVGSNIANVGLVLALSALVFPLSFAQPGLFLHWLAMMGATFMFVAAAAFFGAVTRLVAAIFLLCLGLFLVLSFLSGRHAPPPSVPDNPPMPFHKALALVVFAFVALPLGADWLVDAASGLAAWLGVPERIIGLTLVAVGTSLPELAASLAAAIKREPDLSVGNIVGSNLFNILSILGLSALLVPLPVPVSSYGLDLVLMSLMALMLALPLLLAKIFRHPPRMGRVLALLLFLPYLAYTVALFRRP